jgi:hypothetical protein
MLCHRQKVMQGNRVMIEYNQIINILTLGGYTMSDRTQVAERNQGRVLENSRVDASTEVVIDKVVIRSVAAFSGLIGLWALACLGSAMYQAGGPIQLIRGWFAAVTGM